MLVYLGDIAGAGIMELLVCFTFQQHASVSWGHRVGPVSWNCLFALRSSNMLVYLGDIEGGRYHGERRSVCVSTDRDAPVTVHPIPFA